MFIETLKGLMSEKKVTTNKMLTDLGLGKNSMVNWTKRGTIPNGETLQKLADYFNVSVDYLIGKEKKLPISGELSEELSRFIQLLSKMNSEQKKFLLHLMQTMAQENQE